jgi:hypothetical protein
MLGARSGTSADLRLATRSDGAAVVYAAMMT